VTNDHANATRRTFLTVLGSIGVGGLAGCTGGGGGATDGPTGTSEGTMEGSMGTTEGSMSNGEDSMETTEGSMEGATPTDPAMAPRATVDRFSESAGTLMIRTGEAGLPGPDEPIDFDRAPFLTKGLGPDGDPVQYYNFDVQSTTPAPIYAFFREDGTPVTDQLNVVGTKPGDDGYNDFWQVNRVTVSDDYEANTVTDVATLVAGDYDIEATNVVKNCPIVPAGSTASKRYRDGDADLVEGWYDGKVVTYFLFEEAPLKLQNGQVPLSPIYVSFEVNPGEEGGGPASGFATEMDSDRTHNVLTSLPGEDGYSPLWLVNVYDNADFESVSDRASAVDATQLAAGTAMVNCPVVSVD
jgi:hypothetical protein